MFNPFANSEVNLGRAGWWLLISVLGGGALLVAFEQLTLPVAPVLIGILLINLVPAWFLAKAARAAGRNPLLYGVLAVLGPPISILLFLSLRSFEMPPVQVEGSGSKSEMERFASVMREHGVGETASGMTAWNAFKDYGYGAYGLPGVGLLFQAGSYEFSGATRFHFTPVCQFETTAPDGEHDHFEQLLCELTCPPRDELNGVQIVLWSFDYPSAEAFFAAVEATPEFRIAAAQLDYRVSIRHELV